MTLVHTEDQEKEIKRILNRLETIRPNGNDISPFLHLLYNVDLDDLPENCHWIITEGIGKLEELGEKEPQSGNYSDRCYQSAGKRKELKEIRDSIRGNLAAKMLELYEWEDIAAYPDEEEEADVDDEEYHGQKMCCQCCTVC